VLPSLAEDDKSRMMTEADVKLHSLAEIAAKAADQGIVEFYGCSKCRFIRTGCISYKCNPKKFLAHMEKFPEKYHKGEKELSKEIFAKMSVAELIGGGPEASTEIFGARLLKLVEKCNLVNRF
jgi:hypothetical protein